MKKKSMPCTGYTRALTSADSIPLICLPLLFWRSNNPSKCFLAHVRRNPQQISVLFPRKMTMKCLNYNLPIFLIQKNSTVRKCCYQRWHRNLLHFAFQMNNMFGRKTAVPLDFDQKQFGQPLAEQVCCVINVNYQ